MSRTLCRPSSHPYQARPGPNLTAVKPVRWADYEAVLFDLDGVVTDTARLHSEAWKAAFDSFLRSVDGSQEPFDIQRDYLLYVDGRPRFDGVAAFLESRGIELPWGDRDDPPGHATICALGNLKNASFNEILETQGADVYPGAVALLDHLDSVQVPAAIVSASANCGAILQSVGLLDRFAVQVDGLVAAELGIKGKPAPDPFLEAARRLEAPPASCVVIEDAISGVNAGRAGGFGLVIGVDLHDEPSQLLGAGADMVVGDLGDLIADPTGWSSEPFRAEPWSVTREGLEFDSIGMDETLFALGNGNLGVRGTLAQGSPVREPAALLNGFFEGWPIEYPEGAHGLATAGQSIVHLPDATLLRISWDGEILDLADAKVIRRLELRSGILTTTAEWPQLEASWNRLVSLDNPEVMAQRLTIRPNQEGDLRIETALTNTQDRGARAAGDPGDPRRGADFEHRVFQPQKQLADAEACALSYRTTNSDLSLTVAARVFSTLDGNGWEIEDPDHAHLVLNGRVGENTHCRTEVVVAYRRDDDADSAKTYLAGLGSFEDLATAQERAWSRLWETSDIEIAGDPVAQQAVRFSVFHLHQATARLRAHGVPARGLTGVAYEGHHFWDSDVFVLPFLAATNPAPAREIIRFRHAMLPEARERAATLSLKGALFPWRTITGEEASAYFLAGTAQYHIDADVVFGLRTYLQWTRDDETLWQFGVEIAVETARMWASLGFWDETGFHIHGVTGPDEYTALVNDNAYTNQMARMNMRFAADVANRMREEEPADYEGLAGRLGLTEAEVEEWDRIADGIVVIRDDESGVTAQDSTFLDKQPWDWNTPKEMYPLLLHFHPLVLYRRKMLKQVDVVMAHFLLPGDTPIDQRQADFDYYDPITTGDSSLSPGIQSAVAARIDRPEEAWRYFRIAASMDLQDRAGNTADGIHLACAAATWLATVQGFAGISLDPDRGLMADPILPEGWMSLRVRLQLRGEPETIVSGD